MCLRKPSIYSLVPIRVVNLTETIAPTDIANSASSLGKMLAGKKIEESRGFYFSLKIELGNTVS